MLRTDRRLRGPLAVVAFSFLAAVSFGPLACDPKLPEMPAFPKAEAPSVELPKVAPPQAPTLPQTPTMPQGGGNCCLRDPVIARDKCAGGDRCCVKEFDDSDSCESHKGFWFFTKEGCAGAC